MKFQIKNRDGMNMYYTEYESCVPIEKLDSMQHAGMSFYLDGKKISVVNLKAQFKNRKPVKISKYGPAPKPEVDTEGATTRVTKVVEPEIVVSSRTGKPRSLIPENRPKIDLENLDFPITSRTVVCITTGKVYKNQSEAAKELKVDPAYISDCVCHDKEYKGYRFRRAVDLK